MIVNAYFFGIHSWSLNQLNLCIKLFRLVLWHLETSQNLPTMFFGSILKKYEYLTFIEPYMSKNGTHDNQKYTIYQDDILHFKC